jgi:phosphomannomutase
MATGHRFDPTILREYDIRGVMGETIGEEDARAVGRSFGTVVARNGGSKVAIGYDGRLSSPAMAAALEEGLRSAGMDVLRVGRGPTPMLYFGVYALEADAGVMVTGSHNPPDYNGFKMMLGHGAFYGEAIAELGTIAASGAYAEGQGSAADRPVFDDYIDRLFGDYRGDAALNVAWDAGNGAVGEAMAALANRLPGQHTLLNEAIDGTFPNHHPDPTVEANLEQLKAAVEAGGCDLGVAFDGDGDRIGAIDGQGRVLWADQLMVLFAGEILSEKPGETIIADVKASSVLFDEIARMGGKPLMWRTGHSLIKAKMRETKAPLAGEMSGHVFFADKYYGFDDALYAAVRLIGIVSRSGESLAALRDRLPAVVNTPEIRFDCEEARKFEIVEEVRDRLSKAGADVNDIDGVRVSTDDGWWLLRASNTQAVLVARCEAKDVAGLERLKAQLGEYLQQSGVAMPAI